MKTQIFKSFTEFLAIEDKTINGVSEEFAQDNPNWEKENETNKGCWNCSGCIRCSYCSYCSDCSGCIRCSDCSDCRGCIGCIRCSYCSDCRGCSGCSDCSDCSGCRGCSGCIRCSDCSDCRGCSGCIRCSYCSDCSGCIRCSDCSDCRGCSGCSYCSDCRGCSGCSDCSDCSGCRGCSGCSGCIRCSYCIGLKNNEPNKMASIPVIENIHQKVLEAVSNENAFDMESWHGSQEVNEQGAYCGTTHCRAGWVVALAGKEGLELERQTDTCFAAMQIYKASSEIRVSPTRFFETNEVAMKDIERCAELEKSNPNG